MKIEINPTGNDTTQKEFIQSLLGMIPFWLDNSEEETAFNALKSQYLYGFMSESKDTEIEEDGTYLYPGDPPIYPIVKITRGKETVYIYHYGLVAIVQPNGDSYATRMD